MNFRERQKYQEIHPAKLLTDITTAAVALYLLWHHKLYLGIIIAFLPSIIATSVIVQWVNLDRYKHSPLGTYIDRYMTTSMRGLRLGGFVVMCIGVWYHIPWLIPLGLCVIVLAWLRGLIFP